MTNEIILILSLIVIYGLVLIWFSLFGKTGLICFNVFATIAANIEVLILVKAFGMEMTLGNILFASTFLITDILSELYGKKEAQKAVNIGILTNLTFIMISQSWLLYIPAAGDTAMPSIKTIFSNTPRLMFASLLVYIIVQRFDVWAYHAWWKLTSRKSGDRKKFLWLRNNGSTLISQFLNALLFTFAAFYGKYSFPVLMQIVFSSYIIFIVTSLADTPIVYLARYINNKKAAEPETKCQA